MGDGSPFPGPQDKSPIETADIWYGGAVASAGGGLLWRCWRRRTAEDVVSVLYGPPFAGVLVERVSLTDGEPDYFDPEIAETHDADPETAAECRRIAAEMIEKYTPADE